MAQTHFIAKTLPQPARRTQLGGDDLLRRRAEQRRERFGPAPPPPSLKGQGSCPNALAQRRNVGGGRGGKPVPFIVRANGPAPHARAHAPLSHLHTRAPNLPPNPARMLREGGGG